ncbi:DUF2637 domain-containing protein [Actinoplanes sp. NPDC024001]|uniref:DUF2637 domain-containing protein n=1 Tax=Actinoplanes sp. NPDC024001 TaxID=3154598 RepID=UPI0033E7561C
MSQQTAIAEQEAAAARKALPIEERRQAARVMYGESVTAGIPMSADELGRAFARSERWGRDRITEVRQQAAERVADLAETAEVAETTEETATAADVQVSDAYEPHAAEDQQAMETKHAAVSGSGVAVAEATLTQHRRVRWAVRATLALAVVASTVANVLHAHDNPISQTIAAWPPLALLATIELISRVPVHRRQLAAVRFAATVLIASIAAWVSYWHMADVISRYGETGASPYLIPLTVDGLVVVASVCLVELGSRIRALTAQVTR